jgi:hypothetical protein
MRVLVQRLSVLASARQPGHDGRLSVACDPFGRGSIQSFGQRRQDHCDLLRRGFQTVERGMAPGREGGAAGLTAKGLDPFGLAMLAVPDQRVDMSIGDPEVWTLLVGTGEAFGGYPLRCSPTAFHLTPGA